MDYSGEATFAGQLTIGTSGYATLPTSRIGFDAKINSSGIGYIIPFWENADGSAVTAGADLGSPISGEQRIRNINCQQIYASGAANDFTGYIQAEGIFSNILKTKPDTGAVFAGYGSAGGQTSRINAGGDATFQGAVTAPNVTFNLEADDATKYTSTTDADGEVTSVYNGTTLDMKEVGLALVALKAAAAAASDFATLKAAIATALAGI